MSSPAELQSTLKSCWVFPAGTKLRLLSAVGSDFSFLVTFPKSRFGGSTDLFAKWLSSSSKSLLSGVTNHLNSHGCPVASVHTEPFQDPFTLVFVMKTTPNDEPEKVLSAVDVRAEIKTSEHYTYFKLMSSKLTIERRGQNVVFRKGDPLGWRMSSKGTHLRLISPLHGPNVVYSIKITDDVLKWLDRQDPNAKRKVGQKKSDKPEDSNNKLIGYVIRDKTYFYKLTPKPVRSLKIEKKVIYPNEASAKKDASPFIKEKKLKIVPVYTKDLGKSGVVT